MCVTKKTATWQKRIIWIVGAMALCWPLGGHAETQLVLDLIRAENEQLQPSSAQPKRNHPVLVKEDYEGSRLVLHAMYGVGKRVIAEVSFEGQLYLYLRGQSWPIGDQQGRSGLRLVSMSTNCVQLARQEEVFDACVLAQGGAR